MNDTGLLTRRRLLRAGIGALGTAIVGAGALYELVDHGVIPGKSLLDEIDGVCDAPTVSAHFATPGPTYRGSFYSTARNQRVPYVLAYPPNHRPGSRLPLVIALYGRGGSQNNGYAGVPFATALAELSGTAALPPMAMVCADGGPSLYWNPHPGDDPIAMMVDELIPRCQRLGLGREPGSIGATGVSMGGYGALLLAERHPGLIAAVAAISPAIFTSYTDAVSVDRDSYASPADFTADDAVPHASALAGKPVRVASGNADPFHPGVVAFQRALPSPGFVVFGAGCHDGSFFASQRLASLEFLGSQLN